MPKDPISRYHLTARILFLFGIYFLFPLKSTPQDKVYAKYLVDTLASSYMAGRGYVKDGNRKASDFIATEMKRSGLHCFSGEYFQSFTLPVNIFPGDVELMINGIRMKPGVDFIISGSSPPMNGEFKIRKLKTKFFASSAGLLKLQGKDFSGILILIDKSEIPKEQLPLADSLIRTNFLKSAGFIVLSQKERLLFSVSSAFRQQSFPVFEVLKPSMPGNPSRAKVSIEAEFHPSYQVRNVIGYIPGTEEPDSFLVITAHFDHLGMMGNEVIFPGANDNASGVAMMLDMARHFSHPDNKPRFSIAFLAFSGEETGLNGSEFYVEKPLFSLKKISFLINLDMVGTGSEGITVVNGKTFTNQFEKLSSINKDNEYVLKVVSRGESCNSDHCPFYKAGVPAVFIYSMGSEHREYHNIYDNADRVPFTEYEDIFRLLRDFLTSYRKDAELSGGNNQ